MQRLLAWYRVGSSVGAVVALIVANLVPLAGVLWLGWDVWGILIIYWLENGIYGLFNVLKMRRAEGPDDSSPEAVRETRRRLNGMRVNGRPPSGMDKAALIPFFVMHYGIFWVVPVSANNGSVRTNRIARGSNVVPKSGEPLAPVKAKSGSSSTKMPWTTQNIP